MDKKAITAYKINLKEFLNTLVNLYEEGADYIDLEFIQGKTQEDDIVRVYVQDEYMSGDEEDERDEFQAPGEEEQEEDTHNNKKISEDDLDELI